MKVQLSDALFVTVLPKNSQDNALKTIQCIHRWDTVGENTNDGMDGHEINYGWTAQNKHDHLILISTYEGREDSNYYTYVNN